jgi:hypothetical protein
MSDRYNNVYSCLSNTHVGLLLRNSESKREFWRERNNKSASHLIYGFSKRESQQRTKQTIPEARRLKLNLVQREKEARCKTQRTTRRTGI